MIQTQPKRKLHIDLLRLLAAFLVIYNHSAGQTYFLLYTNETHKMALTIFISSFVRNNIPLFFMISGALLLGREESYRQLFSKRIARFLAVVLLASAAHYCLAPHESRSWSGFLQGMLGGTITVPYWFLYSYLALLPALPFLRKIAKQLTGRDVLLLIGLRFLFLTLPAIGEYVTSYLRVSYFPLSAYLTAPFSVIDILYYPLLGYYLENRMPPLNGKTAAALAGIFLGCTAIAVGFTCHEGIYRSGYTDHWLEMLAYVTAPALYLVVKWLCGLLPRRWTEGVLAGSIQTAGTLTLGMYILDPILLCYAGQWVTRIAGSSLLLIPLSMVYCVMSMTVCGTVTWVLKKLPVLKKIL